MKHIKLFESFEDSPWVYDKEHDAYRDPATGYFVNPNSGESYSKYVTDASTLPLDARRIWKEPNYPVAVPAALHGCYNKYKIQDAVRDGKITEKELREFASKLVLSVFGKSIGKTVEQVETMTKLYHSTHTKHAKAITDGGFKLTKGTRNMGAHIMGGIVDYEIDNQGIFLSDNYRLAEFFGINRADGRSYCETLTVYADLHNVINLTSSTACQKDIKPLVIATYNRVTDSKGSAVFKKSDIWSVVDDEEFVRSAKDMGYDSAIFQESKAELRECGDMNALTYVVFDPQRLHIAPGSVHQAKVIDYLSNYIFTGDTDYTKYR